MKKMIALCLTLVMLLSLFPVTGLAEEADSSTAILETQSSENAPDGDLEAKLERFQKLRQPKAVEMGDEAYADADAVFAQIGKMENAPEKKNVSQTELADAAEKIVLASDSYAEGSLERNGDSFTWWTDDGIRCIYSPYMREKYANMEAPEDPEPDGVYNEPLPQRAGEKRQVYLVGPYYGYDTSFTNQYKNEAKAIASAIGDTDGYTLYSGKAATVDKVATAIENGAVVIFDSHGATDYSGDPRGKDPFGYEVYDYVSRAENSYLCLTSRTGLTDADFADGAAYFVDADGISGAFVNGEAIVNHMDKNSPSGLVWMAMCLGMATDTFCEPFRAYGVEVVYGYSQSITFAMDYLYEETFWDNMTAGKSVADSVAAMKEKWGQWDYSAQMCEYYEIPIHYATVADARKYYASFPVVVSDEDFYPGQRNYSISYGACSPQTVKSSYTLAKPNGVLDVTDPAENYRKLQNYIDRYGQTDEQGVKYWIESFQADGQEHGFVLSNTSAGIAFDYVVLGTGEQGVAAVTSFVLTQKNDIIDVNLTMGIFNGETLTDSLSATQPINRKTFTTAAMYKMYESSTYFTAQQVTEYFNVSLQALCAFWDEMIFNQLYFGLYLLGMEVYDGFGNDNPTPNLPIPEGLSYQFNGDCATITGYTGSASFLTIPDVIQGHYVTAIEENAFLDNTSLTGVMLGCNIATIGDRAFAYCSALESIRILQRVTSIGYQAFFGCGNMQKFVVDLTNPAYCTGFGDILYNKDRDRLIQAPGDYGGATSSGSVVTIEDYAFYGTGFSKLEKTGWLTTIGKYAFSHCDRLESVTLGDNVTTIGEFAFSHSRKFTSIAIPAKTTNIGTGAFTGCSSLKKILVAPNNPAYSIDGRYVLFNKDQTILLQVPGGILGSYTLPETVTTIGAYAFTGCNNLTSISIPAAVTTIEDNAFKDCVNLQTIHFSGQKAQWDGISVGVNNEILKNVNVIFESREADSRHTILNTGDQVVIYSPANSVAVSANINEHQQFTAAKITIADGEISGYTEKEIWTVTSFENGTYNFTNGDTILTNHYENPQPTEDAGAWIPESRHDTLFSLCYAGNNTYLQCYSYGYWGHSFVFDKDEYSVSIYVIGKGNLEAQAPAAVSRSAVYLEHSKTHLHTGDTLTVTAGLYPAISSNTGSVALTFDPNIFELVGGTCEISGVTSAEVVLTQENEAVGSFTISGNPQNVYNNLFTFQLKVKQDAPAGEYAFFARSAIGVDTPTPVPAGMTSVNVRCGHSYSQWISADAQCHGRTCAYCHITQQQPHTWDGGKLTQKPTGEIPGIMTYTCTGCGEIRREEVHYIPGDIDENGAVNRDDVIALLLHISMPATFPIAVPADFTGDGAITREDVLQLLLHISMPDVFPLQ